MTTLRTTDALPDCPAPSTVSRAQDYPTSAFITHVVYLRGCAVHVDVGQIRVRSPTRDAFLDILHFCQAAGVECVEVESHDVRDVSGGLNFDPRSVQEALYKILGNAEGAPWEFE